MKRLLAIWRKLVYSLWFRPSLVAAGLMALGFLLPQLESEGRAADLFFLYGGGPDTARALLTTVAGSLITVLALVFSLTLIAMQLVSSQLTPRALRGFLGARMTQVAAGAFVGTVLYCFLVMRHIRSASEGAAPYVPQISVTAGLVLGLFAMGLLLVFVNHIASWMQLSSITRRIAEETSQTLEKQFPVPYAESRPLVAEAPTGRCVEITASRSGFVQYYATVSDRLRAPDGVEFVDVLAGTGAFVTKGEPILRAWSAGALDDKKKNELRQMVIIGDERDVSQDAGFGLRQLADIALKALSPAVNDPTTAVACIDYLQMLVSELSRRALGPQLEEHDTAEVRVPNPGFEAFVDLAFDEIITFAASQPRVVKAIDGALRRIDAAAIAADANGRAEYVRALRWRAVAMGVEQAPSDHHADELRSLGFVRRVVGDLGEARSR